MSMHTGHPLQTTPEPSLHPSGRPRRFVRQGATAAPAAATPVPRVAAPRIAGEHVTGARRVALTVALGLATVLGLVGVPAGWLLVAAQLAGGATRPGAAAFAAAFAGLAVVSVAGVRALSRLAHHYCVRTGIRIPNLPPAWRKSLRAERESLRPVTVVENTATILAVAAVAALVVWFFTSAGDPTL